MTTERKIEIATAVMNNPLLGKIVMCRDCTYRPYGLCSLMEHRFNNKNRWNIFKKELKEFANSIGIVTYRKHWWFNIDSEEKARTERIEFLEKYIEHLKQQSNDK